MKRIAVRWPLMGGFLLAACSGSSVSGFGDTGLVSIDGGPTTVPTHPDATIVLGADGSIGKVGGNSDTGSPTQVTPDGGPCPYTPTDTTDHDGDGWSPADGDCNDCNKFINPGAYDIAGNGVDEDCDGKADDEPTGCDAQLTGPATTTGMDGAKAMDLCRTTMDGLPLNKKTWGVVSADYVTPDGSPTPHADTADACSFSASNFALGFGVLGPKFGTSNVTQKGTHMLGLSSGTARQPTDPGYQDVSGFDKCMVSGAPAGFPGTTPACPGVTFGQAHDGAALRVVVRIPTNALTMAFDSNFFSYEFPDFVCSAYNDTYVVIMTPSPSGEPASANHNIAFDSKGNIISVNAGFLTVCDPGTQAGTTTYPCPEGPSKLHGTGFGIDTTSTSPSGDMQDHASTDWLTTTVSVAGLGGKDVTLLFAVWDSSDGILDTTVLIDNVHWTFATSPNTPVPVDASVPPVTLPK